MRRPTTVPSSSGNACSRSMKRERGRCRRRPAAKFSFVQTNASTEFSAAKTRACGHLGRHRERDRAAAGAEVDRDRRRGCRGRERVDRELRDDLGLGPRHEDTWADPQLEVPERRRAGDVLQRLARRAPGDEPVELRAAAAASSASPRIAAACTAPRPSPSTCAASSSASTTGSAMPARAKVSAARCSAEERATGESMSGTQPSPRLRGAGAGRIARSRHPAQKSTRGMPKLRSRHRPLQEHLAHVGWCGGHPTAKGPPCPASTPTSPPRSATPRSSGSTA